MDQKVIDLQTIEALIQEKIAALQKGGMIPSGHIGPETILYGTGGVLGSLALLSLLVDLEQGLSAIAQKNVTIANDKTFSANNSPFRTMLQLTNYLFNLL